MRSWKTIVEEVGSLESWEDSEMPKGNNTGKGRNKKAANILEWKAVKCRAGVGRRQPGLCEVCKLRMVF